MISGLSFVLYDTLLMSFFLFKKEFLHKEYKIELTSRIPSDYLLKVKPIQQCHSGALKLEGKPESKPYPGHLILVFWFTVDTLRSLAASSSEAWGIQDTNDAGG